MHLGRNHHWKYLSIPVLTIIVWLFSGLALGQDGLSEAEKDPTALEYAHEERSLDQEVDGIEASDLPIPTDEVDVADAVDDDDDEGLDVEEEESIISSSDPVAENDPDDEEVGEVIDERVSSVAKKSCNCEWLTSTTFRERRPSWTTMFSLGYSGYVPEDYVPDFVVNEEFTDYYGTAETALIEATISIKKNFSFAGISLDLGAGMYSNSGEDTSLLDLKPVRLGATVALDTFFAEPYVVPYARFGYYYMFYDESAASQAINGTADGLYWAAGMAFQVDWLDPDGDISSYEEAGIENTFFYAEVRSFIAPGTVSGNTLYDFSSSPNVGGGLAMEF